MGRIEVAMPTHQREEKDILDMSVMRIAVAGTGGLAQLIARHIQEETSHHVVFLSRSEQPQLSNSGYQVADIDYTDTETLQFALRGIDTVISTVTGNNQIELIHAAVQARVRRFAPAEFEGTPQTNTAAGSLDRDRFRARQWLQHYSRSIQSTIFVCGILYERFQPHGLAHSGMRASAGLDGEGEYLVNPRTLTVQVPTTQPGNPNTVICMTAADDVARFVCNALELPDWPTELRMYGQRVTIGQLVAQIQLARPQQQPNPQWHTPNTLRSSYQVAQNNPTQLNRLQALINTLSGHYNFAQAYPNGANLNFPRTDFQTWILARWANEP